MHTLNNGLMIPEIGYGTYPQKESLINNIPYSVEIGYGLIDTSDNYWNEEFVGEGLKDCKNAGDVMIISKFSQPKRTRELETCFNESQSKLHNHLDIYLLHWPYPFLWKYQWRRMEEIYLAGKCKAIGVCNFDIKHLKKLLKFCKVKPVINQFERHPMFQQDDIFEFCQNNGIKVMPYSPIARMNKTLMDSPVLSEIALKYGKTIGQVILRWNIELGCVPIPGASSCEHIKENIDVFDFTLSKNDIANINALERGLRVRFDPKKRFTKKEKLRFLKTKIKLVLGV